MDDEKEDGDGDELGEVHSYYEDYYFLGKLQVSLLFCSLLVYPFAFSKD